MYRLVHAPRRRLCRGAPRPARLSPHLSTSPSLRCSARLRWRSTERHPARSRQLPFQVSLPTPRTENGQLSPVSREIVREKGRRPLRRRPRSKPAGVLVERIPEAEHELVDVTPSHVAEQIG